jgi:hypothetical protein
MANARPRVSVAIGADVHERLKAEADARGYSVTRLTEILIERGLRTLPPKLDDD